MSMCKFHELTTQWADTRKRAGVSLFGHVATSDTEYPSRQASQYFRDRT